jgi:hypothetical protein
MYILIYQTIDPTTMFTTPFTPSMLSSQAKQDLFNKILTVVDDPSVRGMIFGSVVHQMLSQLNYTPFDVDILFTSHQEMRSFQSLMNQLSGCDVCISAQRSHYYSHTSSICSSNPQKDVLGMSITLLDNGNPWLNTMYIHGTVLNMGSAFTPEEFEVIDQRDAATAELLATKLALQDFLANFYINGRFYHKLNDLINVKISTLQMSKKMNQIIRKYVSRGVQITLMDVSEKIAPTIEELAIAKDTYRSKGLTVIPLSQRDPVMAGKAPSAANWTTLSHGYDFRITKKTANIGILCGPSSGIVCIDVDLKDRGVEMFNKMVTLYGPLPTATAVQSTPNYGFHYIFKYDHARMSKMMPKIKCPKLDGMRIGIDMWIQQCQFVVSPSINYTNGKRYKWVQPITTVDALPDMPEWIYELYHTEHINERGIIRQAQSMPEFIEPTPTMINKPTANKVDEPSVSPAIDDDSETIPDDISEAESSDSEQSYYTKYSKYFNVDTEEMFEQLQSYKQMIMKHPECIIGLIILLVMIMSMIGFIILIMIVVALIYHKKIQEYISKHFQSAIEQ